MLFALLSLLAVIGQALASPSPGTAPAQAARQTKCKNSNTQPDGEYNLNPCPIDPEPCYGNCSAWNDDSVIRRQSDNMLFRFAVLDGSIYTFTATSWTSPWTFLGGPFLRHGGFVNPIGNQDDETWTPDAHYINGTYYLFYTDWAHAQDGMTARGTLSYATSPTMELNTWTDHGSLNVPKRPKGVREYSMIDGSVLTSTDPMYMAFGSDDWGIFGVNLTTTANGTIQAVQGQQPLELIADEHISGNHRKTNFTEGGFQFQYGNYTYLFFQRGHCCGIKKPQKDLPVSYRIQVCRAPSPTGPYENHYGQSCLSSNATVFMEAHGDVYGPGSVGVHIDPQIGLYMHYQYNNLSKPHGLNLHSNSFGYNYINFTDGWPVLSSSIVMPQNGSAGARLR